MNPATDPLRFDPSKGGALFSSTTDNALGILTPGHTGSAFSTDDGSAGMSSSVVVDRLMLQATSGQALAFGQWYGIGYNANGDVAHHDIIDSAGGYEAVGGATANTYDNNVIIFRGTGVYLVTSAGNYASGTQTHYGGPAFNNTLIGPGSSCAICNAITEDRPAVYGPTRPPIVYNNLAFGWTQGLAYQTGSNDFTHFTGSISGTTLTVSNVVGTLFSGDVIYGAGLAPTTQLTGGSGSSWMVNNTQTIPTESMTTYSQANFGNAGTDLPSSYTGAAFAPGGPFNPLTAIPYPPGDSHSCGAGNSQSCSGLSASDVFVNPNFGSYASPTLDLRLKANSPAIGAGANFSFLNGQITPGTDIYGQARTNRIDLGAAQVEGPARK